MKSIIFASLFIVNANAITPEIPEAEMWSLGNEYFPVENEATTQKLISINCKTNKCFAYKALKDQSKIQLTEKELEGGKNPGAVICKKIFNGNILILRDKLKNENAFCKFFDGSIVSASGLIK
jgi:hypothetical protein